MKRLAWIALIPFLGAGLDARAEEPAPPAAPAVQAADAPAATVY